uniref:Uncharacterized protein n=1 Tax=Meloidogyne enterolobii TaxID=390850 RepID=A0A6V7YAS3_MELEN|nr:unnamed protein product [Meloidogyne enterolobii]
MFLNDDSSTWWLADCFYVLGQGDLSNHIFWNLIINFVVYVVMTEYFLNNALVLVTHWY